MIWVHIIDCHNHFIKNDVILKLLEAPESWVQIPDIFLPETSTDFVRIQWSHN